MDSQSKSTTLNDALEAAFRVALAVIPTNHPALETLDLGDLIALAWGGEVDPSISGPLRAYLDALPGFAKARAEGFLSPNEATEIHIYLAMRVLDGCQSNFAVLGADESVVISSILPLSPTDAQLCGAA